MKIIKTEYHQVNSEFTYDVPDEDIIKTFSSVERFEQILSHMGTEWDIPNGDPPTDEEYDLFIEFLENYNYDRYDDWWTDSKGGYDVTYTVEGQDTTFDRDDGYDSDEEVLH